MLTIIGNKNFIQDVVEFTGSELEVKQDIKKLLEFVLTGKKEKEFEELTFTAKYIRGLMRVLKNVQTIPEVKNADQIKSDLSENIKKGIEQLKKIISSASDVERSYFEKKYFILTQQNLVNLSCLFADLESLKKYLNYLKRLP